MTKSTVFKEYSYTKRAAELGLIEAQHNLGVMYLIGVPSAEDDSGKVVDEVKALSW